jgi:hypothetical protein
MLFLFGPSGNQMKFMKVVVIEPSTTESVKLTLVNDDPRVHSFDSLIAPPLNQPTNPPSVPDLPVVANLSVIQMSTSPDIIQATWSAALGAQYYIVQTSTDGINWRNETTTVRTNLQFQTTPGDLWVRVAGVNTGQGPWDTVNVTAHHIVAIFITGEWIDLDWSISWPPVQNAVSYTVKVYDYLSHSFPVLKHTATGIVDLAFAYNYAQAVTDGNLVRDMLVTIEPVFAPSQVGDDPPTITPVPIELTNSIPDAPMHPDSVLNSFESPFSIYRLSWDVPMEGDLIRIKVWVSATSGFDPNVTVPVFDFTAGAPGYAGIPTHFDYEIPDSPGGHHPAYYWRAALFDVWGLEITPTNLTAEQVIPAV